MSYERPVWASGADMQNNMVAGNGMPPPANMNMNGQGANTRTITVDVNDFIRTRDALAASFLNLSGAYERALKAYLDHTQVVLNGDQSLTAGHLLGFMGMGNSFQGLGMAMQNSFGPAQMASMALQQQQNGGVPQGAAPAETDPKKRKKRAYKQRDPNAPKRPLTAYFRYLGDMRNVISKEMQENPEKFSEFEGHPGDISKIATQRWAQLSEEEKKPYKQAYQEELKGYNERAAAYAASKGLPPDQVMEGDTTNIEAEEEDVDAGAGPSKQADEDDVDDVSSTSSDGSVSSDDDSDEEEDTKPPTPKAPTPQKKSTKKAKADAAEAKPQTFSSIPNQQFTSINNAPAADAPTATPSRKRKGDTAEPETGKKRGRKGAVVAGADPVPAAPAASMSAPSITSPEVETPAADKKKKKDKKRKSKGGEA